MRYNRKNAVLEDIRERRLERKIGVVESDAEPAFLKGNIVAGTNVTIGGTLSGRLVGAGDITINASGGGGGGGYGYFPGGW